METTTLATGRRAWVEQVMGMPVSLHLRGPDLESPAVTATVAEVFDDLREADRLFSTYREDSQVSALNRGELGPRSYHPMLREVIGLCDQARERTGGFFDALLPAEGGGTRFDPSGLVKGWAVERAAARLRALPERDFCLNAGGDIVMGGVQPWRVGIEDPLVPRRLLATMARTGGAVATSGSAQRGAHIVVPHAAAPAVELLAVTVLGPSLTWSDVYATAAVAMGRGALRWLRRLPGYEGMIVRRDGGVLVTPGWPAA